MDAYTFVACLIGGVLLGSGVALWFERRPPAPAPPEDSAAHWAKVDERRGKL